MLSVTVIICIFSLMIKCYQLPLLLWNPIFFANPGEPDSIAACPPSASACRGQPLLSFSLMVAFLFLLHSLSPQLMICSLAPSKKSQLVGSHILCNRLILPCSFLWFIFFFPSAAYQFWHLRFNGKPSLYIYFFKLPRFIPAAYQNMPEH